MKRIGMLKCGNFEHPNIDKDSPLCVHMQYEKMLAEMPKPYIAWLTISY